MRAPISVVIPTLNAESQLAGCVAALMEGVEAGLLRELIVSDGGSDDATRQIAEEIGAHWIEGAASRGGQLARGCEAAQGAWLLVLHADTQLQAGWSCAVSQHLEQAKAAGYFRLGFDRGGVRGAIVARWANLRSALFGLPYGDQGLLLPGELYRAVGGYKDISLMEDVALARALRGRLVPLKAQAVTSAAKYRKQGWLRRGARNLWTLLRYFAGVSPETLAKSYRAP